MTCIDNHEFDTARRNLDVLQVAWDKFSNAVSDLLAKRAKRRQQKIDRAAFLNLLGKEDWLYKDMGLHEGDVHWASTLPLEKNAALELEKIRQQNRRSL